MARDVASSSDRRDRVDSDRDQLCEVSFLYARPGRQLEPVFERRVRREPQQSPTASRLGAGGLRLQRGPHAEIGRHGRLRSCETLVPAPSRDSNAPQNGAYNSISPRRSHPQRGCFEQTFPLLHSLTRTIRRRKLNRGYIFRNGGRDTPGHSLAVHTSWEEH